MVYLQLQPITYFVTTTIICFEFAGHQRLLLPTSSNLLQWPQFYCKSSAEGSRSLRQTARVGFSGGGVPPLKVGGVVPDALDCFFEKLFLKHYRLTSQVLEYMCT